MGTHVLNKWKNRLEPIDNRCVCCGNGVSIGDKSNYYVPLFKVTDRTNIVVYRNVKYQRIDVGVSRCPKCKAVQGRINAISIITGIIVCLGLAGVLIARLVKSSLPIPLGIIIGAAAGFVIGFICYNLLKSVLFKKKHILAKKDAVSRYDIVKSLLGDGWTFDKPSA